MSKVLLVVAVVPITPIVLGLIALWRAAMKYMRRDQAAAAVDGQGTCG